MLRRRRLPVSRRAVLFSNVPEAQLAPVVRAPRTRVVLVVDRQVLAAYAVPCTRHARSPADLLLVVRAHVLALAHVPALLVRADALALADRVLVALAW
jgi:hypothetical protein